MLSYYNQNLNKVILKLILTIGLASKIGFTFRLKPNIMLGEIQKHVKATVILLLLNQNQNL